VGRYVTPVPGNPLRGPTSNSHVGAWRGLGQTATRCLVGRLRTGGSYHRVAPDTLALTPDHAPGMTFYLKDPPYPNHPNRRGEAIGEIVGYRGASGRVAVDGALMSNGDLLIQGYGLMGPNEKFRQEDAMTVLVDLQGKDAIPYGGGAFVAEHALGLYDVYVGEPICWGQGITTTETGEPVQEDTEAPPPEPWSGEQVATISYDGATRVVTVYGADGEVYQVDPSATPPAILEELQTTAPQGTRLVIDGDWTPADGLVGVVDWYIEQLGEGEKKYGVDEGSLVPQSPDVPSTDWPGGLPTTDPRHPDYAGEDGGTGEAATPTRAGMGGGAGIALAALGLVLVLGREDRE